jgi:hypothetical protein
VERVNFLLFKVSITSSWKLEILLLYMRAI